MEKRCGNCRTTLKFLKRENVQLGKTGFFFGDLSNLLAGAQDLEFWACPNCRKVELFLPADGEEFGCEEETVAQVVYGNEEGTIAQIICPACGAEHDMDDPKCPCCGEKNSIIF